MEVFAFWVFLLFILGSVLGTPMGDGAGRIVGGDDAPDGRYPYIASLRISGRHFCGAAILNEEWLVTAAHCVFHRDHKSTTALVGTNKLNRDGYVYQALEIFWNENYSFYTLVNDIGLVRVERIEFNERVQPVLVYSLTLPGSVPATIIGWGTTQLNGEVPNDLQHLNVTSVSLNVCKENKMPYPIGTTNLCTFRKIGQGACHGDSGGPVVVSRSHVKNGKDILVGLVSWGRPCAAGLPDIHTRVQSYIEWIRSKCGDCITVA